MNGFQFSSMRLNISNKGGKILEETSPRCQYSTNKKITQNEANGCHKHVTYQTAGIGKA